MTPEEKSLLERTYVLTEENNRILRQMRRSNRWGTAVHILYWVLIIGASIGTFYFLQPYIDTTMEMVNRAQNTLQDINGTVSQAKDVVNTVSGTIKK